MRGSSQKWWSDHYDDYDTWLAAGSAGDMAKLHGLDSIGFVQKLLQHPAYDAFWQNQAIDKLRAKEPLQVPVMLVHSLWDQEDIYGNIAMYKALKPKDPDDSKVFLVMGPWYHHQERLDGSATGTNRWESLGSWPSGCPSGCRIDHQPLYLQPGGRLSFSAPAAVKPGFDEYVSDPARPVPFLPRPIHIEGEGEKSWQTWLVSDQREASSRTDVLTYASDILTQPLKISGEPIADLIASTNGSDGDFVVKLIDVYPDEVGRQPEMGGYELMISADILRGRYRNSFSEPSPIPSGKPERFRFALPTANHVFLPGHRVMVQVQSSWFPLYDRNPQRYVENIFFAKPADYQKATIRVFDAGASASSVELPVVSAGTS
jgi:predicted acyl esterase